MQHKVQYRTQNGSWSKLEKMIMDGFRMMDYVKTGTFFSVRNTWEPRAYMVKVAGNFIGSKKYKYSGWRMWLG